MNIWETLGIAQTTDVGAIKRAYAAGAKRWHPEEHPEEFQRLHAAYQQALWWAKHAAAAAPREEAAASPAAAGPGQPGTQSGGPQNPAGRAQEPHHQAEGEAPQQRASGPGPHDGRAQEPRRQAEGEAPQGPPPESYDFDGLINRGLAQKEAEARALRGQVLAGLEALAGSARRGDHKAWAAALSSPGFLQAQHDPAFIALLEEFLLAHKGLPVPVWLEFYYAYDFYRLEGAPNRGPYERLFQILLPRYRRFCQEQAEKAKKEKKREFLIPVLSAVLVMLLFLMITLKIVWVLVPIAVWSCLIFFIAKMKVHERLLHLRPGPRLAACALLLGGTCALLNFLAPALVGTELLISPLRLSGLMVMATAAMFALGFFIEAAYLFIRGK